MKLLLQYLVYKGKQDALWKMLANVSQWERERAHKNIMMINAMYKLLCMMSQINFNYSQR